MNLAQGKQKFRDEVIWFKQIASSSGERLSYSMQGFKLKSARYDSRRLGRLAVADGINLTTDTVAIITQDKLASEIMAKDKIRYLDHDYTVEYITELKNYATPKSRAYVLGLK